MKLEDLLAAVNTALETENPAILEFCHPWYSPYYQLLYILAAELGGPCVELGVETGRGSFSMLQAGAGVIGVDNNSDRVNSLAGHPSFYMIIGSSTPVPQQIRDIGKTIALLHIDTEHSYAQVQSEFGAYKPFLRDGAVVLFDDTNAMDGQVLKFLMEQPYEKFVDDRLHIQCGFGGLIYRD